MRIGISGAQCTGKTTLLKKVGEDPFFKEFTIIKEVVRSLGPDLKINKDAHHSSQTLILETHYKNILSNDHFLTDRCSLDAFAYASHSFIQGKFSYEEHEQHMKLFKNSIEWYDMIFLLPPLSFIKEDGVRDVDKQYQTEIHNLFQTYIKKYRIKYCILTGNVTEKLLKLKEEILLLLE